MNLIEKLKSKDNTGIVLRNTLMAAAVSYTHLSQKAGKL